jgi:dihydroneopterin aldolase
VELRIEGIHFRARHGVLPKEERFGQLFSVDVTMRGDFAQKAEQSDDLKDTVDYGDVCAEVVRAGTSKRYKLLEKMAVEIAELLLHRFSLGEVMVTVNKNPPEGVKGAPSGVSVTVERSI